MDRKKPIRYILSLLLILLMVGVAEWTDEKEVLFPRNGSSDYRLITRRQTGVERETLANRTPDVRRSNSGNLHRALFPLALPL